MKKTISMILAIIMAVAVFVMPASAGWLDPWPTEAEVRALANRDFIDQCRDDIPTDFRTVQGSRAYEQICRRFALVYAV